MAKRKKSRTPAPPRRPATPRSGDGDGAQAQQSSQRPVQAPQVRSKKRTQADTDRRNRMILYGLAGAGIVGLVVALLAVFVLGRGGGTSKAHFDGPSVDFAKLPGLIRTPPPWSRNTADLDARAKQAGVQILPSEGVRLHIHQHLDIFNNGNRVTVPALIGIKRLPANQGGGAELAELHTHDTEGIIHLESERAQAFSLGQFFAVWGVFLSENCVGGLCNPPGPMTMYVNGKKIPATADPVRLVLQDHDEIAIVYGTPPSSIPSSYDWTPSGL